MNVLAIETSTTACCLGLRLGDQTTEQFVQLQRTHSREILPRIAALLADTGVELSALDLLVYGRGRVPLPACVLLPVLCKGLAMAWISP